MFSGLEYLIGVDGQEPEQFKQRKSKLYLDEICAQTTCNETVHHQP
jgi:hypothetical protein